MLECGMRIAALLRPMRSWRKLDQAIDRISEGPERWAAYLHGTRRYLLKRFPYLVVYRETATGLQVIAVAHAKRKPGYWRHRIMTPGRPI